MIPALKSEIKKLLTIRSTYIVSGLSLLLVCAVAFYFVGVKADDVTTPFDPKTVMQAVFNTTVIVGTFVGIVSILHICHEYRYNTIAYTLTVSNSRLKVMLAKVSIIVLYAAIMSLLTMILVAFCAIMGAKLGGATVSPQDFPLWDMVWRTQVFTIGGALIGLLLGFLFRSQVFSIAAYFIIPVIEQMLIGLVKLEGNWLPNTAQTQVLMNTGLPGTFSPLASAGVLALYLVIGWAIAYALFVERDAN